MLLGPIDHMVFPTVPTNVIFVHERPKSSPLESFMTAQALQLSLTRLLKHYPHLTGWFQLNKSFDTFEIGNFSKGVVFLQAECDAILTEIAAQSRSGRICNR